MEQEDEARRTFISQLVYLVHTNPYKESLDRGLATTKSLQPIMWRICEYDSWKEQHRILWDVRNFYESATHLLLEVLDNWNRVLHVWRVPAALNAATTPKSGKIRYRFPPTSSRRSLIVVPNMVTHKYKESTIKLKIAWGRQRRIILRQFFKGFRKARRTEILSSLIIGMKIFARN